MQVTLRNYLEMAHKLDDGTWVVRDAVGNEFWPFVNTPLSASIGHRRHGQPLTTGYPQGIEYPQVQDQIDFEASQCNIVYETWPWNCEKFNFAGSDLEEKLLVRHQNLRSDVELSQFWEMSPNIITHDAEIPAITAARKQKRALLNTRKITKKDADTRANDWFRTQKRKAQMLSGKNADNHASESLDENLSEESERHSDEQASEMGRDGGEGVKAVEGKVEREMQAEGGEGKVERKMQAEGGEDLDENISEDSERLFDEHASEDPDENLIEDLEEYFDEDNEMPSDDDVWEPDVNHTVKPKLEWNSELSVINEERSVLQHLQGDFNQIYASLEHARTNVASQGILTQVQIVDSLEQYGPYSSVSHIREIPQQAAFCPSVDTMEQLSTTLFNKTYHQWLYLLNILTRSLGSSTKPTTTFVPLYPNSQTFLAFSMSDLASFLRLWHQELTQLLKRRERNDSAKRREMVERPKVPKISKPKKPEISKLRKPEISEREEVESDLEIRWRKAWDIVWGPAVKGLPGCLYRGNPLKRDRFGDLATLYKARS